MNIPKNSTIAATYATSTAPSSQSRTSASQATPPSGTAADPAATGVRGVAKSRSDTIELSSQGLRLSLTQGVEKPPAEEPPPPPEAKAALETDNPPLLGAKESTWQNERKSKLDRLETLVRQGQYKVDPFILDELAVRMARLMY